MSTQLSTEKLPKGLFLASFILLAWLAVFAVVVRWNALPNLAELLPKEETEAFWMLELDDLKKSQMTSPAAFNTFLNTPLENLPWVSRVGGAWMKSGDLSIAEVNSKAEAQDFLESLKTPEEEFLKESLDGSLWSTVYCYSETQPYCFTWVGDLLFVADQKELLISVQKTALGELENLESDGKYQNVRGRLAHWNGGFYYLDLQKVSRRFMDDFGAAASLLQLFPSMGGALEYPNAESFLAVDKTLLGDQVFYRPEESYQKKFLPWTSKELAWEWGGQNLYAQWKRMEEILSENSPSAGIVWRAETMALFTRWFGADFNFETQFAPFLDKEQYFAFTPNGHFLFITELEAGEAKQLDELKNQLISKLPEQAILEQVKKNDSLSYELKVDGQVQFTFMVLNNAFILSDSPQLALSTLDRALGQEEPRNLQEFSDLLSGADEVVILHCPLLPDGNILKTLGGKESILSTRKLFDDGVFTRTHFSHD
ncbi:hypothetical protein IPG41_05790 [Candidatus Peregrinibacteria bacterium]|nr:MAG: hypothetical protein IPG41_05790 [Candidatus Peregrinibacteria bacterium]